MWMKKFGMALLFLLTLSLLRGCTSSPSREEKVKVSASIFPLADIVRNVGGDLVQVDVLIPPGASPHVFEPTPEAFRQFARTRLFVMVGAGLEFWAEKLITATAGEGLVVLRAVDGVEPIHMSGHIQQDHEPDREDHECRHANSELTGANPHVWLDPLVAKSLAQRVAHSLEQLDPEHSGQYRRRVEVYQQRFDSLDETIRSAVENFRLKEYVAFHPAWSYFARRYGLREVGVIQESPGRDPTPRQIERIVQTIREYGIQTVFIEPQFNPDAAVAIASEAGAKVLILDPLGDPDQPGRDSYLGLMEYNLRIIREAME